jgi:hypothetical protein
MIGRALLKRSIKALVAGNDFSISLSCASLKPEAWPMSSMSQCSNILTSLESRVDEGGLSSSANAHEAHHE